MEKINKVLLAVNDYGFSYASMYIDYFEDVTSDVSILFDNPGRVGMLSFTGGEDVSPHLYGENRGRFTGSNSRRDAFEVEVFNEASRHNIPMVGICRGSQFLNVMCGGKLIQDTTRHGGVIHPVTTYKGERMLVNSTHHQMSIVGEDGKILAYTDPPISEHYLNGDNEEYTEPVIEVESFVYPKHKVIGWQYHPEMIRIASSPELEKCVSFVEETLMDFIFNEGDNTCQVQQ